MVCIISINERQIGREPESIPCDTKSHLTTAPPGLVLRNISLLRERLAQTSGISTSYVLIFRSVILVVPPRHNLLGTFRRFLLGNDADWQSIRVYCCRSDWLQAVRSRRVELPLLPFCPFTPLCLFFSLLDFFVFVVDNLSAGRHFFFFVFDSTVFDCGKHFVFHSVVFSPCPTLDANCITKLARLSFFSLFFACCYCLHFLQLISGRYLGLQRYNRASRGNIAPLSSRQVFVADGLSQSRPCSFGCRPLRVGVSSNPVLTSVTQG